MQLPPMINDNAGCAGHHWECCPSNVHPSMLMKKRLGNTICLRFYIIILLFPHHEPHGATHI
jgi:hypothetical protein